MKTLSKDYTFYAFSGDLPARLHVSQNELFVLESCDCFSDQLNSDQDTLDSLDWDKINPATGPVAIAGVKPGDIVRIDIQKIEFTGRSVMTTIPGSGVISGITEPSTRVMDNSDGVLTVVTDKGVLSLPIEPMIGVIGLAPAEGSVPTGTPGKHGGNMDCKLIGEGAKLYLEAAVDGGLFGCGDVQALMGDGEVLVCGAETPAGITLSASILNEPKLRTPFIETDSV
ncbi:MAG: acetamidase/formamidase family protein, partial [Eubacteriales bacterium]|nr:acetamidase/formamidase family protein [Eubacteriales bacterium]